MEESWENWHLHTELDCDDDYLTESCAHNTDGEEFLREILLQQPSAFSSESESHYSLQIQNDPVSVAAAAANGVVLVSQSQEQGNLVKSNSSNSIVSQSQQQQQQQGSNSKTTRRSSSPRTYILSFDNSTMIPATPEPCVVDYGQLLGSDGKRDSRNPNLPSKRTRESQNPEPKICPAKKARSTSQTIDHIMAERKRRQELTERFIALSATIPGLSKTDKASVLRAAIDYVKQLQERVQELEKQDTKRDVGASVIVINKKPYLCGINNSGDTTSSETSCDDDCNNNTLPEIEARVMGKEVLIEIHCEKENGIELKLLNHLENLHLFVTGSSVLPFGNSALSITIIAQIGDEHKLTVNDLVKSLRQVLLKSQMACDSDPY